MSNLINVVQIIRQNEDFVVSVSKEVVWRSKIAEFLGQPIFIKFVISNFFGDFLRWITLNDLETIFLENVRPRASFWRRICVFKIKFEIWSFWPFFAILDLCWPLMTLRLTFLKSLHKFFMHIQMAYTDFIRKKL